MWEEAKQAKVPRVWGNAPRRSPNDSFSTTFCFNYYVHVLQVQTKQATESDYEYDSYDSWLVIIKVVDNLSTAIIWYK